MSGFAVLCDQRWRLSIHKDDPCPVEPYGSRYRVSKCPSSKTVKTERYRHFSASIARAASLHSDNRKRNVTLGNEILQTLCRRLPDFARKLLVRYGAGHTDRTDQRAIGQNRLRSRSAPIRLVLVTNQSCEQLNVVPNVPADE